MELEEIGNWVHDDERGVSPVIGVILMVAITVILAAVIAAFVLDLGQGQSANAQAGMSFDENTSNSSVKVTINSVERADTITVEGCSVTKEWSDPSAGDSVEVGSCSSGDTVQVIGSVDGSENVITDYEYSG